MNFIGANSILRIDKHPHCGSHFSSPIGNLRIWSQSSGELGIDAFVAFQTRAFSRKVTFAEPHFRANHFAIGPSNFDHELLAVLKIKVYNRLLERRWFSFSMS
jgi:hypothetical protein